MVRDRPGQEGIRGMGSHYAWLRSNRNGDGPREEVRMRGKSDVEAEARVLTSELGRRGLSRRDTSRPAGLPVGGCVDGVLIPHDSSV